MQVPKYDTPTVQGGAAPFVPVSAPQVRNYGLDQAEQMNRAGQNAGNAISQIAMDMQQQANQLRVDDALNRVKETALKLTYDKDAGFTSQKGINALERQSGKPLADEYADNLKEQINQISGSLGNDAQRQVFSQHANNILTSFHGQAMQHESQEFKNYGLSVAEGVQTTALREIGLNWNNPETVNAAVERIRAETYRQAQLLGKSADWQEAQARKLTSNAHKVALLSALEAGKPDYAETYLNGDGKTFKGYASQMEADDILSVRGHITKEMDNRTGTTVAGEVFRQNLPRIQTSDSVRAFNIAVGTESNGRQFAADGSPLTSPKGAVGIAQVMPGTGPEAAKLAGVAWDENRYKNDATYNKAIGYAYFQKQLQDFGGDLSKAYAAYNAGPGALRSALAAEKNPKNDTGKTWLEYLPKETQDYVAKNMKAYESGQGQLERPTFADIDNQLRADPRLAGNPARYKVAREEVQRLYTEQEKAIKQREEESVANAMRGVIENGGRYSDLPASIRANIPPKEVDNVINFAQKISKGDDTTSLWLYNKLANNPDAFTQMSDSQFFALRRELSEADFKHFSNERAKRNGAALGSSGPGDLNSTAIKQTLDDRLRMLSIDPTPKDDGGADAARVGGIRRFVNDYFMAAQREAGKKFTDAEVSQHLDALFAKNVQFRTSFLGINTGSTSMPLLGMKVGDIDGDTKKQLTDAFKRQGIANPTDAQIMNAYFNMKVSRK